MRGNRSLAWFGSFVAVVLIAGAGSGVLMDRYYLRHAAARTSASRQRTPAGRSGPMSMRHQPGWLLQNLSARLQLSPEQQRQVKEILARRQDSIERVRADMQARMAREQEALRAELEAVLTPEQRKQFRDLTADRSGRGVMGPGTAGRGRAGKGPG